MCDSSDTSPLVAGYEEPAVCAQGYRQSYDQGLISRVGWAIIDDSATGRWEPDAAIEGNWRWFDASLTAAQLPPGGGDVYFFGHGHRYGRTRYSL